MEQLRPLPVVSGAEVFARVTFRIIHTGLSAREAIKEVAAESPAFVQSKVQQALDRAARALDGSRALSKEERCPRPCCRSRLAATTPQW